MTLLGHCGGSTATTISDTQPISTRDRRRSASGSTSADIRPSRGRFVRPREDAWSRCDWRGRHCFRGCCESKGKAKCSNQPDHLFLPPHVQRRTTNSTSGIRARPWPDFSSDHRGMAIASTVDPRSIVCASRCHSAPEDRTRRAPRCPALHCHARRQNRSFHPAGRRRPHRQS
jgi:hypothetical protein